MSSDSTELVVTPATALGVARPTTPLAEVQEACAGLAARLEKAKGVVAALTVADDASAARADKFRSMIRDIRKSADESRLQIVGEIKRETARVDAWVRENINQVADGLDAMLKTALDPIRVAEADRELYAKNGRTHWAALQVELPPNASSAQLAGHQSLAQLAEREFTKAAAAAQKFWPETAASFTALAAQATSVARQYETAAVTARQQEVVAKQRELAAAQEAARMEAARQAEADAKSATTTSLVADPAAPPPTNAGDAQQADLFGAPLGPFDDPPPWQTVAAPLVVAPVVAPVVAAPVPSFGKVKATKWVIDTVDLAVVEERFVVRQPNYSEILAALAAGDTVAGVVAHRETVR